MIEIISSIYHYILQNFVFVGGLAAGLKWIYEYSEKRKFEKSKFLLERVEKFDDLGNTKLVKQMLDWNKSKFTINGKVTVISDATLIDALITHDKKQQYTDDEVWIRGQFDEYFDNLNEFILLSEYGLIDKKNLKKMMKYWIEILNGQKNVKKKQFSISIKNYLLFYGYHDVAAFIS